MTRILLLVVALALLPTIAVAQTPIINPTLIEFNVSANHNAVDALGQSVVSSYEYNAVGMAGSGAMAVTVNIGKPVAVDGGFVSLPIPGLSIMTLNAVYTATMTAKGPGGASSGPSAPSNSFRRCRTTPGAGKAPQCKG